MEASSTGGRRKHGKARVGAEHQWNVISERLRRLALHRPLHLHRRRRAWAQEDASNETYWAKSQAIPIAPLEDSSHDWATGMDTPIYRQNQQFVWSVMHRLGRNPYALSHDLIASSFDD